MKATGIILGIVAATVIIIGGVIFSRPPSTEQVTSVSGERSPVPDFTLLSMDGSSASFSDYRGTPLLINSWAAWCPFCVKELPDLVKVQEEFGDDIKVIAINRSETLQRTRDFLDELGVRDKLIYLLDPKDTFYKSIGGFTMPETIFVDRGGNIQFHKRGVMSLGEIRERTKKLLDE